MFSQEIFYKTQIGVCVQQAFKKRGYQRADNQSGWNIYWAQKQCIDSVFQNNRIGKTQKVNHYRSYYQLCRKDNLNRNLKKYKRLLDKEGKLNQSLQYNFYPLTYHLPIQYNMFSQQFKRTAIEDSKNIWIMKPVSRSQGKGIFLFNKLGSICQWAENPQAQAYIAQKYIDNPLLIGNKKFDLRLYVLCTSYRPLNIYLYRDGFARFTHFRYDIQRIDNKEIHLTNVAIQKHTNQYNQETGGKWQLRKLKLYLLSKYKQQIINKCFYDIQLMVVKTLKSVVKIMSNQKYSFQLYGFDILIDSDFKPWLIEINGSPSMRANTQSDKKMKIGLIDDVLSVIDLQNIMLGNEEQIGGFDIICQNDISKTHQFVGNNKISMLGCINNRQQNYRQLAKNINLSEIHKKQNVENSIKKNTSNISSLNSNINQVKGLNNRPLPQLNSNLQNSSLNKQLQKIQQSNDITTSSPQKSFSVRKQFGKQKSPVKQQTPKLSQRNSYLQQNNKNTVNSEAPIGLSISAQFDATMRHKSTNNSNIENPIHVSPMSPLRSSSKNWIIRRGKRTPGQQSMPQKALFEKIQAYNPQS